MMAISKKVCVLLLLLSLAGLFSCRIFRPAPTPTPTAQEVEVRRGNLEVMVMASGNLNLPNQQKLAFASPGNLQELLAEVGQEVRKGQVLARLEMAPLEGAVRQAEANLANARYALDKAENPYKDADIARAQAQVASAKAALASAQDALDKAKDPYKESDTARAQAQVASAKAALASAQDSLDRAKDPYEESDTARAQAQVASAKATLASAQDALDRARDPYKQSDIARAEAAVNTAQASLLAARDAQLRLENPPEEDLTGGRNAVALAQEALLAAEKEVEATGKAWSRTVKDGEEKLAEARKAYQDLLMKNYGMFLLEETIYVDPRVALGLESVPDSVDKAWKALLKARDDLEVTRLQQARAEAAAKNSLSRAQEALRQAQENLSLLENPDPLEIERLNFQFIAAQASLKQAQAQLGDILSGADPKDVKLREEQLASAQVSLTSAQAQLDDILAGADPKDVKLREEQLASAQASLASAQAQLGDILSGADPKDVKLREEQLASAQASLVSAQAQLDDILAGADPKDVRLREEQLASAQASLTSAQAGLDDILSGADPKDVKLREEQLASAQASHASAQAQLNDILKGPDLKEVELREAQLRAAQDSLDQARESLSRATITAPFDGVVAATNFRAGEYAPANAAVFVLVDTSRLEVEALVDEQDIPKIRPGQEARTVLDALPTVTFQGQVKAIAPLAQRQAGLINYRVLLSLEGPRSPDGAVQAGITLREGLTVTAEILVDKRENVLLVPNRALSRRGQERVVKVVAGERLEERVVVAGPSDGDYTEITSGLKEGEKVQVESSRSTPTPSSGGGLFFGR
ncbi:MAG: efflux RND transporter periplasmic adaptor subunit [Chloroflexi bacterium]|nr:efflux RND transporter periplasmic adaptor subunit [Chloroflexota bacterium]